MMNAPPVAPPRVFLHAWTAADLMSPNPVSLEADATVKEAIAFLADAGFGAAPVIDEAGRPIGVLSQADIVVHDRENVDYLPTNPDEAARVDRSARGVRGGFQVECVDRTTVRDVMTPMVIAVTPDTLAYQVIEEMLGRKIHRLFVVDSDGVLVGVITSLDVLRHLRQMP